MSANRRVGEQLEQGLREVAAIIDGKGPPDQTPLYGIIDPDYARIYTIARCVAWSEGYALMMHGSFTRDLDLIAVPWTAGACEPDHLVHRIEQVAKLRCIRKTPNQKLHGRLVWTLLFHEVDDPRFVDLSVMPRKCGAEGKK